MQTLIEKVPMDLQSIEIVYNLVKSCSVEQSILDAYVKHWFELCKKQEGQYQS